MLYFNYASRMALFALAFALLYVRFILPVVAKARDALVPLPGEERLGKVTQDVGEFLGMVIESYLRGGWAAWCAVTAVPYARLPETTGWYYIATAFIICETALAHVGRRDGGEGMMTILRSVIPMGAFAEFAFSPDHAELVYGWVVRLWPSNFF